MSNFPAEPVLPTVEPVARPARRRRRAGRVSAPYLLVLPALIVIVAVLGYPMYRLFTLSFQQYGLVELIHHQGTWIGLDNYQAILRDHQFWTVLFRTMRSPP